MQMRVVGGLGGSSGGDRRGYVETFQVAGAKGSAWGGVGGEAEEGLWGSWRPAKGIGVMRSHGKCRAGVQVGEGCGRLAKEESQRGARADSRTPAGRLLGQLQPVDGEAVGTTAHTAPLALALHVALCLAHVCCLDLVAAVALGTELQAGIQVTPGGGCCQARAVATTKSPRTQKLTQSGDLGDGRALGTRTPRDHSPAFIHV